MRIARKGYTMRNLKNTLDELDRVIQFHNDLNDQVLVIEEENEWGEQYQTFEWRVNVALPAYRDR